MKNNNVFGFVLVKLKIKEICLKSKYLYQNRNIWNFIEFE